MKCSQKNVHMTQAVLVERVLLKDVKCILVYNSEITVLDPEICLCEL